MYQDPIVEEVHQARAEILAKYQGNFEAYFADLMQNQREGQRNHPENYSATDLRNRGHQQSIGVTKV